MKGSYQDKIRNLLNRPGYQPLNKSEFARELGIRPKDRAAFRKALNDLESRGEIVCGKKSRYRRPDGGSSASVLEGKISFSRDAKRRSAFFLPDDPSKIPGWEQGDGDRIFVPGRFTSVAIDGDRVRVRLAKSQPPRWMKHVKNKRHIVEERQDRWEGRVEEVVARGIERVVGVYHRRGKSASLSPEDMRLPSVFRLIGDLDSARPGDMVVADFESWDSPDLAPVARLKESLGKAGDPGVDILTIIHRYGLPLEFPREVEAEAERFPDVVVPEDWEGREDWRDREVFTIDPEDARDFDDAISVSETGDGKWELAVHIADVSHYVKPGSALDREAQKRGNSVYLVDRVIPMLPQKLSNGLCSLRPEEDRLTHAVVITFDENGKQKAVRFISAVIHSRRRFTYEEAHHLMMLKQEFVDRLEDEKERQLARHLKRAWKLASLLRKKRFDAGALDLDFPDVRVILDEKGIPVGVKKSEYDESHQLIEEFMLAANEAVAKETKNAPASSIYRIHEDPDFDKLQEFSEMARSFGHPVGDVTQRAELQKLLKSIRGKPEERSLKIGLLKSLRRASYSKDPLGHYGLAKVNYTHFTSPIRRYADLVVHRVLKRVRSKRNEPTAPDQPDKVPNEEKLAAISSHISTTERVAADAEMESQQLKMIEYLERVCEEDPRTTFLGTVFEVRPIGAFVELDDLLVKGLLRKQDLPSRFDFYFDRPRMQFVSRHTRDRIAAGDELEVRLVRVDRARGFIDFALANS